MLIFILDCETAAIASVALCLGRRYSCRFRVYRVCRFSCLGSRFIYFVLVFLFRSSPGDM